MNTTTQYVYYIKHKQAAVNKWKSKQMKENPTGDPNNHLCRSSCAVKGF